MKFCSFMKRIDFFGKLPEFYIKRKPKQVTFIGRVFTIIFILLYILFFGYKIYRVVKRVDITFYDSYSNPDEIPSYELNNENFYLIFSIYNETDQPFIEESIYYPKAYYVDGEIEEIPLERCNIEKIGSKYKHLLNDYPLNDYYCLSNVNYNFVAYTNSLKLLFFPCKNNTENNNKCKSKEIIDNYLNGKNLEIIFEDNLITPLKYETPIKETLNLVFTTIYKTFGQYLYTEMQLVNIETTTNIFGFDFLTNPKIEKFIKYYSLEIIPQPGYNLDEEDNNYPICEVEFQLNDKILLEKRQYLQFIDALGEVGGLMEIIYSFFGLICNFVGDFLYEKTIANNLFSFDIQKKIIVIKNKEKKSFNMFKVNLKDETMSNNRISANSFNFKNNNKNKLLVTDEYNKEIDSKVSKESDSYYTKKKNFITINRSENEKIKKRNKYYENDFGINKIEFKSTKNIYLKSTNYTPMKNNKENLNTTLKNDSIIDKIHLKDLFISFCFCFFRKRKNIYKILLNETMNIITEKLDIFNVFKNLYSIEIKNDFSGFIIENINMSDNGIKALLDNNKNI